MLKNPIDSWVNYNISLTWIVGPIWGWFPLEKLWFQGSVATWGRDGIYPKRWCDPHQTSRSHRSSVAVMVTTASPLGGAPLPPLRAAPNWEAPEKSADFVRQDLIQDVQRFHEETLISKYTWLVVWSPLKNISWEGWHPIYEMENNKCLKPPTRQSTMGTLSNKRDFLLCQVPSKPPKYGARHPACDPGLQWLRWWPAMCIGSL